MKTIAITNWNDIISPLYDASCRLVIIKGEDTRKEIDIRNMSLMDKANLCAWEGVQVLICGAISSIGKMMLQDKGIEVVSWVRGPINDVLGAYQRNVNLNEHYAMPGCGGKPCQMKRRHRHSGSRCKR